MKRFLLFLLLCLPKELFQSDVGETYSSAVAGSVVKEIADNAVGGGGGLDAAGVRAAVGLASANLDTQLSTLQTTADAIPTNAELATALGTADDVTLAAIATAQTSINDIPNNSEMTIAFAAADDATLAAIDDLPTNAELATALGTADDATLTAIGDLPTAAEVADAVWDEALAGHATAGSAGAGLSAAGAAGDPWSTLLPGAYGVGTAGYIIGNASSGGASAEEIATAVWVESIESKPASEWLHRAGAKP